MLGSSAPNAIALSGAQSAVATQTKTTDWGKNRFMKNPAWVSESKSGRNEYQGGNG
jgi:hypothetical protein